MNKQIKKRAIRLIGPRKKTKDKIVCKCGNYEFLYYRDHKIVYLCFKDDILLTFDIINGDKVEYVLNPFIFEQCGEYGTDRFYNFIEKIKNMEQNIFY